jgi:hypothetical protein
VTAIRHERSPPAPPPRVAREVQLPSAEATRMAPANILRLRRKPNPDVPPSSAALFSLVWDVLADLLGTATTAVLVHRAARRATGGLPELGELEVSAGKMSYRFNLPRSWLGDGAEVPRGLRALLGELVPLLLALTGPLGLRRLGRIAGLRGRALLPMLGGERTA